MFGRNILVGVLSSWPRQLAGVNTPSKWPLMPPRCPLYGFGTRESPVKGGGDAMFYLPTFRRERIDRRPLMEIRLGLSMMLV